MSMNARILCGLLESASHNAQTANHSETQEQRSVLNWNVNPLNTTHPLVDHRQLETTCQLELCIREAGHPF